MNDNVFIPTTNFQRFQSLCEDLLSTQLGLEMACVIGPAGRGKTVAAQKIRSMSDSTVYLRFQERLTHIGLVREAAFVLSGVRPRSTQACFEAIQDSLAQRRRIILVDEADRMSIRHLNTLRDLHDMFCAPVVMIGEGPLDGKLKTERRLESRVASKLYFEPVSVGDVAMFYQKALGQQLSPKQAGVLVRHGEGDFRMIVNDAVNAERRMKASGLPSIIDQLVLEVCGNDNGGSGA